MNKVKIDNYYKPESKTLRLDEADYTIIPNSDIKPLLDKLQQENKKLNGAIQTYDILLKANVKVNKRLTQKITKALEKIEDYNLGKYDYSIPSIGVIELKEILEGKSK